MTNINEGVYGAKVQSWDNGPRAIFRRIIDQHPDANTDELTDLMTQALAKDLDGEQHQYTMNKSWVANAKAALTALTENEREARAEKRVLRRAEMERENREAESRAVGEVDVLVTKKAKLLFLSMTMPNGKSLGDCTGAELRKMKCGALFSKLERTLKDDQKCRAVYKTDAALAKLTGANK